MARICDLNGTKFARGIARFDFAAVRDRRLPKEELVQRDDLVLLWLKLEHIFRPGHDFINKKGGLVEPLPP